MSPGFWAGAATHTENISRNGLLISWRGESGPLPLPAVGQIVTVDIELPANHSFGQKCIHCQGAVARVSEHGSESPLIALRVNYMDFRSFHDRLRVFEMEYPAVNSWMA
jgi:hypothetical protein